MRRSFVLLLALGALLATAAVAQAATVYFAGAIGGKSVRPRTVYLSADGTLEVIKVTWSSWDGPTAVGSGTAAYHGCDPNCAAGKKRSTAVTVKLTDRVTCKGSQYDDKVALVERSGRQPFVSNLRLDTFKPCR